MKNILILTILFSFYLSSCSQEKKDDLFVIFKQNKEVSFELKKLDTMHKYSCKIQKNNSSSKKIIFNICGVVFSCEKFDDSLEKIELKDIDENSLITFDEFFKLKNMDEGNLKRKLFFLEKTNEDMYLKYPVELSSDFYEIEKPEKLFKKF